MRWSTLNLAVAFLILPMCALASDRGDRPKGTPQNAWRYEFYNGRWWYWTPDDRWAFYNGREWVTSPAQPTAGSKTAAAGAARHGELGPMRGRVPSWAYSNYGGSSFYDPIGKSSAGQTPGGLGTIGGAKPAFGGVGQPVGAAGTSELGISGSRSGDAGSGVGGGSVGGTSVTSGLGRP
ncbi:MAG TPA: hypothetical protein VNH11_12755 [Pirellulales bacterium]|nr:hypothetical protein [Pirellulales bacterium]